MIPYLLVKGLGLHSRFGFQVGRFRFRVRRFGVQGLEFSLSKVWV